MNWSVQTDKKINELFKNNKEFKAKLLEHDADAIRELATFANKVFTCEEVIDAYENDSMEYLYKLAKRKLEITRHKSRVTRVKKWHLKQSILKKI